MNFRFKQSLKMLAVAGAISGLVACGGGSDSAPATVTTDLPAITLNPANAGVAKAVTSALVGQSVALPASGVVFTPGQPKVPAASALKFEAVPAGAPAEAITGVTIDNEFYTAKGYAKPGSLVVTITSIVFKVPAAQQAELEAELGKIEQGGNYTIPVFAADFNTAGLGAGQHNVPVTITLGGVTVQTTVTVTVTDTADGKAGVTIGNTTVPVDKVTVTGSN